MVSCALRSSKRFDFSQGERWWSEPISWIKWLSMQFLLLLLILFLHIFCLTLHSPRCLTISSVDNVLLCYNVLHVVVSHHKINSTNAKSTRNIHCQRSNAFRKFLYELNTLFLSRLLFSFLYFSEKRKRSIWIFNFSAQYVVFSTNLKIYCISQSG